MPELALIRSDSAKDIAMELARQKLIRCGDALMDVDISPDAPPRRWAHYGFLTGYALALRDIMAGTVVVRRKGDG